jgi:hypothetical protein
MGNVSEAKGKRPLAELVAVMGEKVSGARGLIGPALTINEHL